MMRMPRAEIAVGKVKRSGVKPRNRATSAVTAKLNPIDRVNRSIVSNVSFLGNRVSVRQYPGRNATEMKAKK